MKKVSAPGGDATIVIDTVACRGSIDSGDVERIVGTFWEAVDKVSVATCVTAEDSADLTKALNVDVDSTSAGGGLATSLEDTFGVLLASKLEYPGRVNVTGLVTLKASGIHEKSADHDEIFCD